MSLESCVERKIPHVLDNLRAAHALARVAHQVFEKRELLRSQLDGAAVALYGVLNPIHFQVLDSQDHFRAAIAPPNQRAHPGGKLRICKRLDDKIIRAHIEQPDAIVKAIAVRQNQDGKLRALAANFTKQVEPVVARKIQVQNRGIVFALLNHAGGIAAVGGEIDRVTIGLKTALQKRPESWIAFRDQ